MPLFDFKCARCGNVRRDVLLTRLDAVVECDNLTSDCRRQQEPVVMERLPAAPAFSVHGKYTARNNYGLKEGK